MQRQSQQVLQQRAATSGADSAAATSEHQPAMQVGLIAAPGLAREVAEQVAAELPDLLRARFAGGDWNIVVREEVRAGVAGSSVDLVQVARKRMVRERWRFAICLTDLPLHVNRRPVTAYVSIALGVGVVSVPALGAVGLPERVRDAVLRLIDMLLGGAPRRGQAGRIRRRLRDLVSPLGRPQVEDERTVRFVTAPGPGNLRLLAGMIRANHPWRLIAGLSRALAAALGTAAFGIVSPAVWWVADGMGSLRLVVVALASILAICISLIVSHGLWERSPEPEARERVLLFNLATTLTILLGVLTLFVALMVVVMLSSSAVLVPGVLRNQLKHDVALADYVRISSLVSALATLGGALGAALESDAAVREAAYGYRPDEGSDEASG